MKSSTDMGMNRTGSGMSPIDSRSMEEAARKGKVPPGDEQEIAKLRAAYTANAEPVGTVPPPATVKGAVKSGAKMLKGEKPTVFIDKLGERLAFERTGTRLYELAITKLATLGGGDGAGITTESLREIQLQELEHMQLIKEAMEKIGADPTAQTPGADVVGVMSLGLVQVLSDPRTTVSQALTALLNAELVDNASWEALIELAENMNHDQMAEDFRRALAEEQVHLQRVRSWLGEAVRLESEGSHVPA